MVFKKGYIPGDDGVAEPFQPMPTIEKWTPQEMHWNRQGTVIRSGLYLRDRRFSRERIEEIAEALNLESKYRKKADELLDGRVTILENDLKDVYAWKKPLAAEIQHRIDGDKALRDDLDAEILTRSSNDSTIATTLASETTDRVQGDTDLENLLNALRQSLGTAAFANVGINVSNLPAVQADGKLPPSVIPAVSANNTFIVDSEAEMLALSSAGIGDMAIRTDTKDSFILKALPASNVKNWMELVSHAQTVTPIALGGTGAVTRKAALDNLTGLGTSPADVIGANDTPTNWAAKGTGFAWVNVSDLTNPPTLPGGYDKARVMNYILNGWSFQEVDFSNRTSGSKFPSITYTRTGSGGTGGWGNWERVLKAGSNGTLPIALGGTNNELGLAVGQLRGRSLTATDDLNNFQDIGKLILEGAVPLNAPSKAVGKYGFVIVDSSVNSGTNGFQVQRYVTTANEEFVRYRSGNPVTWGPWSKVGEITGILPIVNGGTGNDAGRAQSVIANGIADVNDISSGGVLTSAQNLTYGKFFGTIETNAKGSPDPASFFHAMFTPNGGSSTYVVAFDEKNGSIYTTTLTGKTSGKNFTISANPVWKEIGGDTPKVLELERKVNNMQNFMSQLLRNLNDSGAYNKTDKDVLPTTGDGALGVFAGHVAYGNINHYGGVGDTNLGIFTAPYNASPNGSTAVGN